MSELMKVGPDWGTTGTFKPFTSSPSGSQRVNDAHGRFSDAAMRYALFSAGSGATALSANTITLTNTTTPIVGVWNPPASTVNLFILQIAAQVYINTLTTPVGCGPLVLASSVGNTALTLGVAPFNMRTLASSGGQGKAYNGGIALTGLTNNLVVFGGGDIPSMPIITHGTVTAVTTQVSSGGVYNVDGSIVVPPGGMLALLNTTSTTTVSVASRMMWEEVPILP